MNIYRIVAVSIVLAIIAVLPVSNWLSDLHTKYKLELEKSKHLQLKVETIQQQAETKATEAEQLKQENKSLQDQKSQLEKDLQAKRERQAEEARIAAENSQRRSSAILVSQSSGGSGSCVDEIRKYDWPQQTALAVMNGESSNVPGKVNDNPRTGDYSVGCFQVNLIGSLRLSRPSEDSLKTAEVNVRWAYDHWVSEGRNFCKPSGWINTCRKLGMI